MQQYYSLINASRMQHENPQYTQQLEYYLGKYESGSLKIDLLLDQLNTLPSAKLGGNQLKLLKFLQADLNKRLGRKVASPVVGNQSSSIFLSKMQQVSAIQQPKPTSFSFMKLPVQEQPELPVFRNSESANFQNKAKNTFTILQPQQPDQDQPVQSDLSSLQEKLRTQQQRVEMERQKQKQKQKEFELRRSGVKTKFTPEPAPYNTFVRQPQQKQFDNSFASADSRRISESSKVSQITTPTQLNYKLVSDSQESRNRLLESEKEKQQYQNQIYILQEQLRNQQQTHVDMQLQAKLEVLEQDRISQAIQIQKLELQMAGQPRSNYSSPEVGGIKNQIDGIQTQLDNISFQSQNLTKQQVQQLQQQNHQLRLTVQQFTKRLNRDAILNLFDAFSDKIDQQQQFLDQQLGIQPGFLDDCEQVVINLIQQLGLEE